jgi:hypothetical protein
MKPEDKAKVQQALDDVSVLTPNEWKAVHIPALRQLLEQPVQEPVAWHHPDCEGECIACLIERDVQAAYGAQGLAYLRRRVTTPPAQPTEPDYKQLYEQLCEQYDVLVNELKAAQSATEDSSEVDHGDELTIAYLDGVHTGKQMAKGDLLKALEELLEVQDEPCVIDHQGYCQSHYLDNVNSHNGCRVANARALVAKVKGGAA